VVSEFKDQTVIRRRAEDPRNGAVDVIRLRSGGLLLVDGSQNKSDGCSDFVEVGLWSETLHNDGTTWEEDRLPTDPGEMPWTAASS
jgi:hypothetical protein